MVSYDALFPPSARSAVTDTSPLREAVQILQSYHQSKSVVWLTDPDDPESSTFVAKTPQLALQWMVQQAKTKARLISCIRDEKKRPRGDKSRAASAEEGGSNEEDADDQGVAEDADGSPARKRTRVGTRNHSMQFERDRTRKQAERDACQQEEHWYNPDEELERAAWRNSAARWFAYTTKLEEARGVGKHVVEEIVRTCESVGNSEAVLDLQLALSEWRRKHPRSSSAPSQALLEAAEPPSSLIASQRQPQEEVACPDRKARHDYSRITLAERMGAGLNITRRFYSARLRSNLENRLVRRARGSRQVKGDVGTEQVAMFHAIFPELEAQKGVREFDTFVRTLRHGKRWLQLEKAFGAGIFALLPKSTVPSTYIERTLTDNAFAIWIKTLQVCSPLVVAMAKSISSRTQSLAADWPPPADYLPLEMPLEAVAEDFHTAHEELGDLLGVPRANGEPIVCHVDLAEPLYRPRGGTAASSLQSHALHGARLRTCSPSDGEDAVGSAGEDEGSSGEEGVDELDDIEVPATPCEFDDDNDEAMWAAAGLLESSGEANE